MGKIMRFKKYSFIKNEIQNHHIFKIKEEPLGNPFVSYEFRDIVRNSKLLWFVFQLVWDSEE